MTDHLVAYEYGTGQVWGYIRARSVADIESIVPEVEIFSAPPSWMADGELRALRDRSVYLSGSSLESILHHRSPAV